uniref:Uncharacterized protein n=1 Tax=Setaria italica TaxID=4555 RepID=K4AP12_SETIT
MFSCYFFSINLICFILTTCCEEKNPWNYHVVP